LGVPKRKLAFFFRLRPDYDFLKSSIANKSGSFGGALQSSSFTPFPESI
jgi:hypothetical protein